MYWVRQAEDRGPGQPRRRPPAELHQVLLPERLHRRRAALDPLQGGGAGGGHHRHGRQGQLGGQGLRRALLPVLREVPATGGRARLRPDGDGQGAGGPAEGEGGQGRQGEEGEEGEEEQGAQGDGEGRRRKRRALRKGCRGEEGEQEEGERGAATRAGGGGGGGGGGAAGGGEGAGEAGCRGEAQAGCRGEEAREEEAEEEAGAADRAHQPQPALALLQPRGMPGRRRPRRPEHTGARQDLGLHLHLARPRGRGEEDPRAAQKAQPPKEERVAP
mmetsp:Transcript_29265/g.86881  ORF Transcript_29265/g.86881 Transcript_29265/m.86881 type:complete len:274 (+) Transcript_29265:987-1808(+)